MIKHSHARTFVILAALAVAAALLFSGAAMSTMDDALCPFAHGSVVCGITPLDHVSMWRSMLAGIITLVLCAVLALSTRPPRTNLAHAAHARAPARWREFHYVPLLQWLFSKGILNPKTF